MKDYSRPNRPQATNRRRRPPFPWGKVAQGVGWGLLTAALVAGLWFGGRYGYQYLQQAPWLAVQYIRLQEDTPLSRQQILQAAGLQTGMSMLAVAPGRQAQQLKEQPWVKQVRLQRQWPQTVTLEVISQQPVAIVLADYLYYINGQGVPFKQLKPGDALDFPVVTGISQQQLQHSHNGCQALQPALQVLRAIRSLEAKHLGRISEIHLSSQQEVELRFLKQPVSMRLGQNNFEAKLRNFLAVRPHMSMDMQRLAYIDLTLKDQVIVRRVTDPKVSM